MSFDAIKSVVYFLACRYCQCRSYWHTSSKKKCFYTHRFFQKKKKIKLFLEQSARWSSIRIKNQFIVVTIDTWFECKMKMRTEIEQSNEKEDCLATNLFMHWRRALILFQHFGIIFVTSFDIRACDLFVWTFLRWKKKTNFAFI